MARPLILTDATHINNFIQMIPQQQHHSLPVASCDVHVNKWQRVMGESSSMQQQRNRVSRENENENENNHSDNDQPIKQEVKPAALSAHAEYVAKLMSTVEPLTDDRRSFIPDMPNMRIEARMAPHSLTAFQMLQANKCRLSFGDSHLDGALCGGITEGITELVGEAACGKTQIAMQLMLQCQLPVSEGGLGGSAMFLAMEGDFPISRLHSLATSFKQSHPNISHNLLNKIYIKRVDTPAELWSVLSHSLRPILESGDVKLIVMDSVAAMFRTESGEGKGSSATGHFSHNHKDADINDRSQELLRMAALLKQYSSTYHIPILVINQVADFFAGSDANNGDSLKMEEVKHSYLYHWSVQSSGRAVVPALGLLWANCVNTRLFLSRKHEFVFDPSSGSQLSQSSQPLSQIDKQGFNPLINMFTPGATIPERNPTQGSPAFQSQLRGGFPSSQASTIAGTPPNSSQPPPTQMRRLMRVQFSSHLPQAVAEFIITSEGVKGVDPKEAAAAAATKLTQASAVPSGTGARITAPRITSSLPPPPPSASNWFHNMFTPSVGSDSTDKTSSPSPAVGSTIVSTPAKTVSYFDEEDDFTPSQERKTEEALMQVERELQRKQQALAAPPKPIFQPHNLWSPRTSSPTVNPPQSSPVIGGAFR